MLGPRSHLGRCLLLTVAAASWVEEFIARYQAQGLGMIEDLEDDWTRRTREYGVRRPTQVGRVFVYRAFDLWTQTGPFYRATVATHQMMIPDELLWRIALHWPDLGNEWNQVEWRLVPVDDSIGRPRGTDDGEQDQELFLEAYSSFKTKSSQFSSFGGLQEWFEGVEWLPLQNSGKLRVHWEIVSTLSAVE